MYSSTSSLGRPKTRNQWNDFYMDYNAEKKRKRSLMSESGSSRERIDTTSTNKKKKKKNSHGPSPTHFESDEEIKTTSKKAKKSTLSANGNGALFKDDHNDNDIILIDLDDNDGVEVQELSYKGKVKKKYMKEKKQQQQLNMIPPKQSLGMKEKKNDDFEFWEVPKSVLASKEKAENRLKGMTSNHNVKFEKQSSIKMASEHAEKKGIENKKKKAATLGKRQFKRASGNGSDDEVVFLGESFTGSRVGLKLGSSSGSKVGSVGGMGPDMATHDEVASSTTQTVNDSIFLVSSDESSDSDDAPLESRDSDKSHSDSSDEEGCDDSEDSDYIEGKSSSSGLDDEEKEISSGSEESDEEVDKQKEKEIDEKHKYEERQKSEIAEILEFQEGDERIDDRKHESEVAEKDDGNVKTKAAIPMKDKKKQRISFEERDSIKDGEIVSRLRSRSSAKIEENRDPSSDSSFVDNKEKEKQEEENKKKNKKKPRGGKLNVKNILLNTMMENKGNFNEIVTLEEDALPKQLPLKFTFYEDDCSPEKEEWEVEIDNLFADLQMGRLQSETSTSFAPTMVGERKDGDDGQPCWHPEGHLQILDEQIGIVCKHCDLVFLESKYIFPDFAKRPSRRSDRRFFGDSDQHTEARDIELDSCLRNDQTSMHAAGTVWDLVPGHIKARMYLHQRQGFEFIWKNIAGDLLIENLKDLPANGGKGCIISHAPGTGKTGLTVVFLCSFLKLFPLCHPVVIAPRSMLLTWENEFKKWDTSNVPFHNLNSNQLSGKEDIAGIPIIRGGLHKGKDVNRLLKVYSWAKGSGILGITYGLFEKMAGGGSSYKEEDEKLQKILLKFPGLLVLDEGHTPRNEESNIYNTLSKVETPRRIILSGTPFQNNFHELHNTLSLVRPGFGEAGPTTAGGGRNTKARKSPTVGRGKSNNNNWASITCSVFKEENGRNVEQLKQIIAPLVHVHKGTILQEKLPGLVITELYLKLTETQQNLQNTISRMRSFIERDNWMTLISVHPSLSPDHHHDCDGGGSTESLELDPRQGVKTRFVHELIALCRARGERVIIFSRLLEPLALIKKQLLASQFFRWTENKEVLYMDGKIPVRHRQERIRAFNDPESDAKVLLASTAACCEGINLIGGSRIVLLDVVWNPSVTRQAISRAYRLGQTRMVYVYNLISSSFEAKKYACQAKKDRMSELVFADEGGGSDVIGRRSGCRDVILDAMSEDPSMCSMFERIVHQPKNQQML